MTDYASIAKNTIKYKFTTGIAIYDDSMLECQQEDAELVGSMAWFAAQSPFFTSFGI